MLASEFHSSILLIFAMAGACMVARGQSCIQYSYQLPAVTEPCGNNPSGGTCGPATGSQVDTTVATGPEYCSKTTTDSSTSTSTFFPAPGYITSTYSITYANQVVPSPFIVCNGQSVTQGTGQVSKPNSIPPETFISTTSGTTLTETEIDGVGNSIQTTTSVFDITTGAEQYTQVSNAYSFVAGNPTLGSCSETLTSTSNTTGTFVWQVIATPIAPPPFAVNPYANNIGSSQAPGVLDPHAMPSAPVANSVAADGLSAVVLIFQSGSADPASVTIYSNGSAISGGTPVGALSPFDPGYLMSPNPPSGGPQTLSSIAPLDSDTCAAAGLCTFLALLWGPAIIPTADGSTVSISAIFSQAESTAIPIVVTVGPPPLLLVHNIWSNPQADGFTKGSNGFYDFIGTLYQSGLVFAANYGADNAKSFDDANVQAAFSAALGDALAAAASQGVAARSVDVVGHGMGGLVPRYFLNTHGYEVNPALVSTPIHTLITIGTPHFGTPMAATLRGNSGETDSLEGPIITALCPNVCTLGELMSTIGRPLDTGVESLQPTAPQLQQLASDTPFSAIAGQAPNSSITEYLLNALIYAFLPSQTVGTILGPSSDTFVPLTSQAGGDAPCSSGPPCSVTVTGTLQTSLCQVPGTSFACTDVGEMQSTNVWTQAFEWLTGPGDTSVSSLVASKFADVKPRTTIQPAPVLNLNGYAQVAASNVSIVPATGAVLTIGLATDLTATSSTKTITEFLLLQTVATPTDSLLLFATQSPFTIPFTPNRLGSTTLAALTVFSDSTYAITPLTYTFQPDGIPLSLSLNNVPLTAMPVGVSRTIKVTAQFASGPIDVTSVATVAPASGTNNVFEIGSAGTITATGAGVDQLNVSYGTITATATITVGACTYSVSPPNQLVPYNGGALVVQVTAPQGCSWSVGGGAPWLVVNNSVGNGNGSISLTAQPNTSGGSQYAGVTVAGAAATFTQPATPCTYILSQRQVNAPQTGATGNITATTSCPLTASSSAPWLTAYVSLENRVSYSVAANSGPARSAVLTIGSSTVNISQPAGPALSATITHTGTLYPGEIDAAFVVTIIDGASAAPTNGTVVVAEDLPPGLSVVTMSGDGWTCPPGGTGCIRSDTLAPGISYPPITVVARVGGNVGSVVLNQIAVTGGGSSPASAGNTSPVAEFSPCDVDRDGETGVSDVQAVLNEALGLNAPPNGLSGSSVLTVLDVQLVINAAVGLGCGVS